MSRQTAFSGHKVLSLVVVAGLALAGCGPTPEPTPIPAPTQPPTPTPVPMVMAETFRVCLSDSINTGTLDPHKSWNMMAHQVLSAIFNTLVKMDQEGEIIPQLATEWKRLDELTIQFELRQGVTFHNGEPFDAEAVKFTFDRALDPATRWPVGSTVANIDRVDVVDEYTVNVVSKIPDSLLLREVAAWFFILPPKYLAEVGEEAFGDRPVGTGPYKFVEWRGKGTDHYDVVLEANEDYWAEGLPKSKEVIFRFMPSDEQLDALLDDEIDLLANMNTRRNLDVAEHEGTEVVKGYSNNVAFMKLNVDKEGSPLQDVRVRLALSYAIDREGIVKYVLNGNGRPLASLTPSGAVGYNPDLELYEYDVEKAEELLREAAMPMGLP